MKFYVSDSDWIEFSRISFSSRPLDVLNAFMDNLVVLPDLQFTTSGCGISVERGRRKYRIDLPFYDSYGKIKHAEVEFSFPADQASTALSSIGICFVATSGIPESKGSLKHQLEQFCFNHPGFKAEFTEYGD